jgi:RNA polymerase sigma factor (TIGR02999 family)
MPLVYEELRRLAGHYMRRERPDHTLQTTALIHEAYLRLVEQRDTNWKNRAHFFAVAAQLMRRILVDHARACQTTKRGGEVEFLSLEEHSIAFSEEKSRELIALDEALTRLAELSPRQSQIIELRFFGGLTVEETAEALQIAPRTVKRDWRVARAWLHREVRSLG